MGLQQHRTDNTPAPSISSREACLEQIGKLSDETLRILAELSTRPGVEKKLKDKYSLIKAFL